MKKWQLLGIILLLIKIKRITDFAQKVLLIIVIIRLWVIWFLLNLLKVFVEFPVIGQLLEKDGNF